MPKKIDKSQLVNLYDIGYTQREIAYLTGCSVDTVNRVLKGYKNNNHFREVTEEDIEKVIRYYQQGYPIFFIAQLLNIKASKVLSILEEYLDE